MFRLQSWIDKVMASVWGQDEEVIYDPFWEDMQRFGEPKPRNGEFEPDIQETFTALTAAIDAYVQESIAAVGATWNKTIVRGEARFLRRLRHRPVKYSAIRENRIFAASNAIHATSKDRILPQAKSDNKTSPTVQPKHSAIRVIASRLQHHLTSAEFWLGVVFGAATRISTRMLIFAAFQDSPGLGAAVGFLACAVAGVLAGMVTYLVRTRYRNARAKGIELEPYWCKGLFESALIGLFGGMIGGYAVNASAVISQSSGLAIGATAGVAAGVIHAGVKIYGAAPSQRSKMRWSKFVFQSALFGVFGGALGVTFGELLGTNASVAASVPVGEAGSVIYVPPASPTQPVSDFCRDCGHPPPPPQQPIAAPVQTVHVAPVEPQDAGHKLVEKQAPQPKHQPSRPHAHKHLKTHTKTHTHEHTHRHTHAHKHPHHVESHAKKITKVRHLKKLRPAIKMDDRYIVLDKPKYLTPPPQAVQPPPPVKVIMPPPPPVDPCDVGHCAPSCDTVKIDVKGPCSDPSVPCVQKVVFNADGEATKVVLESRVMHAAEPYYEIESPKGVTAVNWRHAGQSVANAMRANDENIKVSLLMPIANNATLALANAGPMPV